MPHDLKRYQHAGHLHFLTFSCYCRKPLLDNDALRSTFERSLERLRRRHNFHVFAYVLMPEHVHLLVSEPDKLALSKVIGALKTEVSKKASLGEEPLWQKRYYDFNVFTQTKFVEKLRYIHRNPVTRGLVERPEKWPWSSFRHWLTGEIGQIEIESEWTWNRRERAAPKPNHNNYFVRLLRASNLFVIPEGNPLFTSRPPLTSLRRDVGSTTQWVPHPWLALGHGWDRQHMPTP